MPSTLAREAERLGWSSAGEFMFTLHIYQIQGGTASRTFNVVAEDA